VSRPDSEPSAPDLEEVRSFWQRRPCGAEHAHAPEGSPEFFRQIERSRDELEPFIARYARFEETVNQRVLEIGTGLGTDLAKFARAGARVTGVDLTEKAISLTRARLDLEGLEGDLYVADAERLPFGEGTFDVVYSWGVLHHTPDTDRAVNEAIRVLRPGGRICVMLYSRRSWVALGLWTRHALLAVRPHRRMHEVIANHMESAGTRAYTVAELRSLFDSLCDIRVSRQGTPYDRRVAGPLAALTGAWLGWFLVVEGQKSPARA
jgi:SAM-dependent methyltransferase